MRSIGKKSDFFAKKLIPIAKKIIQNPGYNFRLPIVAVSWIYHRGTKTTETGS